MTKTGDHSMKTAIKLAFGKAVVVACAAFAFVSLCHHGGLPTDPHHHADHGTSTSLPSYWWCPAGFTDIQCGA